MKKMTKSVMLIVAIAFATTFSNSVAADKNKPYPLKTCIVSDEKLGGMGETFTFVYNGQVIKLCCTACQKDFNKSPDKFVKKLVVARAKAKKS